MNVLILCTDYPNTEGNKALYFAHMRNKYYLQNGIDVTVLNFSAKEEYCYESIKVIPENQYPFINSYYDILICHAPNTRQHYKFLKKYGKRFNKIIFIFHGHEVLKITKEYPPSYPFVKNPIPNVVQNLYDLLKLKIWRKYIINNICKLSLVFVSNYLYMSALKYLKFNKSDVDSNSFVINNSVGKVFEQNHFDPFSNKQYDFITIRSNLDSSTYCIDLLCNIAINNPELKFLLIGKGRYFDYNTLPKNIALLKESLNHEELTYYINISKAAIMLTRNDSQGLMSCELATFGIPLITSRLPVTEEIFSCFLNVTLIENSDIDFDFKEWLKISSEQKFAKCEQYFAKNTVFKEIELIEKLIQ